jgi:hypothetical protein
MVRLKSGKYIDPATVFVVDILLCLQCKIGSSPIPIILRTSMFQSSPIPIILRTSMFQSSPIPIILRNQYVPHGFKHVSALVNNVKVTMYEV